MAFSKPNPLGMSDAQMEAYCANVMDPQKAILHCGRHGYIGSDTPPKPNGCKNCWEVYWWFKIASTPAHLRQERLEQAFRTVYDAVRSVEKGTWDFKVDETYPEAKITKDGFDDETGKYKE